MKLSLIKDFSYSLHTTHYMTVLINVINAINGLLDYRRISYISNLGYILPITDQIFGYRLLGPKLQISTKPLAVLKETKYAKAIY